MRIAELVTAVILAIMSLYFMWESGPPPQWEPEVGRFSNQVIGFVDGEGPGKGFWPFWLSVIMFGSCIWIIINWFRGKSAASQSDEPFLDSEGKRLVFWVCLGLLGFLVAINFVGFYGAIPLFIIYYMKFIGSHRWLVTMLVALITPVILFLFFDIAMRIVLPKGKLDFLFLPLYELFY